MISVGDCVETETYSLIKYEESSNERLLNSLEGKEIVLRGTKTKKDFLERRKTNFKEKPLHLQFMRKTDEVRKQGTLNWLKIGPMKKETEGMFINAEH